MALSISSTRGGPMWPLGFIKVPTIGTPVALSSLIDPTNLNSPNTATGPGGGPITNQQEYTISFRGLSIFGYKPGANNNGMVANSGNIYLLGAPAGGAWKSKRFRCHRRRDRTLGELLVSAGRRRNGKNLAVLLVARC